MCKLKKWTCVGNDTILRTTNRKSYISSVASNLSLATLLMTLSDLSKIKADICSGLSVTIGGKGTPFSHLQFMAQRVLTSRILHFNHWAYASKSRKTEKKTEF